MKVFCLTAVLISVISPVRSQSTEPWLLLQAKPGFNKSFSADQPSAKLFEGTVYFLPQDNMPCLVPPVFSSGKMPVHNPPVSDLYMPNPYFRQDLVSLNKTGLTERNGSKKLPFDLYDKSRYRPNF